MAVPGYGGYVGYSPLRPPELKDLEIVLNGDPNFLGVIVSAGAAVDNNNTAIPFSNTLGGLGLTGTLAGKALLLLATAPGHVMGSVIALGQPSVITVTTLGSTGPFTTTVPGVKIQAEERLPFLMDQRKPFLQFIPTTGAANLFVWELL